MTWKDSTGVSESTTKVQIYCSDDAKQQWEEEVESQGYKSLSTYLFELIQEARAYREEGFLSHHQSEEQIEELEQRIETLEKQLDRKEKRDSGNVQIDDPEFLYRFLDYRYKTLDKIMREIVESGALDDMIRKPVEDQLYFLASQEEVEYNRGHGWKLKDGDRDG
ncbi:hypothetical protein [Natronobacterium texcoconense]|uniref:Uncharacterized protein n=1 Tax=Natronobacterium texcoconense TaxID=1095778 RepID=A0A1H1ANY4_NATTX|nr:hypothetical protein [Natronobacterium texcoconense]SDQ40886.1 hypothetical protein SAMN04489842_0745 [Natronobacterium texcoconense]